MLVKQKMKMSQHSEQHLVPKCQGYFCCGSMEKLIKKLGVDLSGIPELPISAVKELCLLPGPHGVPEISGKVICSFCG